VVVNCSGSGCQVVCFGGLCVVAGVRKEGSKRRPEVTYRMRGLLQWRHENGATEGCGRSSEVRMKLSEEVGQVKRCSRGSDDVKGRKVNGRGQLFVASAVPASNPHHQALGRCFGSARSTKRIRPARLPHH
jgi:hypothetical protein